MTRRGRVSRIGIAAISCETLLRNLRIRRGPFDEIIVADNGSTDDSAEFAERAGARVLRLGRNLGFAAAVNRGIEAAQIGLGRDSEQRRYARTGLAGAC